MPAKPVSALMTRRPVLLGLATACNGFCNALASLTKPRFPGHALANAADRPAEVGIVGLANGPQIDERGWVVIPYGDSRHSGKEGRIRGESERTPEQIEAEKAGVIQRFTREDALALVNDFKSTWGKIKRAIVGLPVYRGHPDAPRFAKQFPDLTPRGTIADMEVRDEGLALKPVLTEQGAADVESGWKFVSPYWLGRHVGDEAGRKVVAPRKLLSLGLVPRGNIPDLSLVNAADPDRDSSTMNDKLRKFLQALGLSTVTVPAENADDAALANALDTAAAAVATLKKEKTDADGRVAALEAEKTKLEGEKVALANAAETAAGKATAAETTLKDFRARQAKARVALAVKAGKLRAADAATHETALANAADFDAEAAKLDALRPALRTASDLGNLGATGKEQQSRTTQVIGLVNARMESTGEGYDQAFAAVQANPAHKALFDGMKQAPRAEGKAAG